jgi:hypothetical protein
MKFRTGMIIGFGIVGALLCSKPALASSSTCDFLQPGVCSTGSFEICYPEGPWGPAYCTTNTVEFLGQIRES